MKNSILVISFLFLLFSCDNKDKAHDLALREKELLNKEKLFAQKEAEYQSLLKMRDSIFNHKNSDSIKIVKWSDEISGAWIGKVICTESNCSIML
ncbi:hypothetical protein [Chryseobacterium indoltheticum]|uniref:hypothetical protein n=1 Tax=Chryseobacterium indoltheticum TaxID=254 RepID=UPI003F492E26